MENHQNSFTKRRRRPTHCDSMDFHLAKAKLEDAKLKYGRVIHVFETSTASSTTSDANEETDDFFEFTAEDYRRMLAVKKDDKVLKTRKLREAEEASRKSRITKAVMRVRFPDNYTLEATFHPSETIQTLVDLVKLVVTQPDLPFIIYTTPPKKQVKEFSQNFSSAGFIPGAIVYFSYVVAEGDNDNAISGPFLKEDVLYLKDLDFVSKQVEKTEAAATETEITIPSPATVPDRKLAGKKPVKPKWLKM